MPETKRREARVKAALPVNFDGRPAGMTKDVSASGVFFETEADLAAGSAIEFTVEFYNLTGKLVLHCNGRITRIERSGGKTGVAARILESKLELKSEMTMGKKAGAARHDGPAKAAAAAR